MNSNSAVVTSSGRRLRLGPTIGKGGEGTIYSVLDDEALAVKIYAQGKEGQKRSKVEAMIADRLSTRSPFVAAPVDTVFANGAFIGFAMKKASDSKTIHLLCIPSDRIVEFPEADYRFLVHTAMNYAKAIASVHSLGAIVGDVNESGALVNQKGLVTLIDSDSFQYKSRGQLYRCVVGKPEYTPPELQKLNLSSVERTVDNDAFGIAVIIFELLFMGRHPFSGIYKGPGNQPTIAEAIQRGRFAYSPFKSTTMMEPPPHVPILADIPPEMASAFQRAFAPKNTTVTLKRPDAAEWVKLLETMEKNIVQCRVNTAHQHFKHAPSCPWCRFEAGLGTILFIPRHAISVSSFDLDRAMARIHAVQNPGPAPDLVSLMPAPGRLSASQAVQEFRSSLLLRRAGGIGLALLSLFAMLNGFGLGFFLLIPAGFVFFGEVAGGNAIQLQIARAKETWAKSLQDWSRNAGNGLFNEKKAELENVAKSYRALPGVERDMLAKLESMKRQLQLRKHLESRKIDRARIESIGDGRKLTLRSFGIDTAWDVTSDKVRAVPGFGEVLTGKLLTWRRAVEAQFKFNPSIPTDPAEIAKVRAEIAKRRAGMETELTKGVAVLEAIRADALAKRRNPAEYRTPYLEFRQAEIDAASM